MWLTLSFDKLAALILSNAQPTMRVNTPRTHTSFATRMADRITTQALNRRIEEAASKLAYTTFQDAIRYQIYDVAYGGRNIKVCTTHQRKAFLEAETSSFRAAAATS